MLKKALLLFPLFAAQYAGAQTLTGAWFGRADVVNQGTQNNYLTEFILKQKGDEVEGIFGYYFKDSYQSFFVRGTYDKNTREVYIPNLSMFHYSASTRNGIECPMNFHGKLMVSQAKSTLSGSFITEPKYKYTCPELRTSFTLDIDADLGQLASISPGRKFWQPQQEDVIVSNAPVAAAGGDSKPVPVASTAVLVADSIALKPIDFKQTDSAKLVKKFDSRQNIMLQELEIEGDSIRISFYDNGDIDHDTISVLLNKTPILMKQELSSRAITVYVALSDRHPVSEIGMFADNLGKYPPNTALMVVTDGLHRYEMYLSSSLSQNATVRLRKKKK
ncbi:hypothetical protein [Paraflavitalea sp. CAU 1676]|uniref:hypothetical protein n=1 Tax=Paraflavitalea sp. CAU 1676 TaxID=3032598 RepID=UPI0023DA3BB4|nr:hypothetical protein [Paraflavitalea sp. CAU 1676]MDF2191890.1 hypothetical protein [Paraflavitalea sp. CAU 1676]